MPPQFKRNRRKSESLPRFRLEAGFSGFACPEAMGFGRGWLFGVDRVEGLTPLDFFLHGDAS